MKYPLLKKIASISLIILFFMPLIGTLIISSHSNANAIQYDSLQIILMGIYNLPLFLVSLVSLLMGSSLQNKFKESGARIALVISIISSIVGSLIMLIWALSTFDLD